MSLKSFITDCSPSYIPNNLTSSKNEIFYIHNSEINPRIIKINKSFLSNPDKSKYISKLSISNDKSLEIICHVVGYLYSNEIVVYGMINGIKIISLNSENILYEYSFNEEKEVFVVGICVYLDKVFFSDSYGRIYMININSSSQNENKEWEIMNIYSHSDVISSTCICICNNKICFGNQNGDIFVISIPSSKNKSELIWNCINKTSCPSISMRQYQLDYLIVGYMNGEIKIFSLLKQTLLIEFSSHLRSINGIEVDNESKDFISFGDDSYLHIYEYSLLKNDILIKKSFNIQNKNIVGALFLNENNKKGIVVSCYDSPEIYYTKSIEY